MADRRRSRFRFVAGALTAGGAALLAAALAFVVLRPEPVTRAGRVTTNVTGCDLSSYGAAQVTFTVRNDDRSAHGYRVDLTVVTGTTPVGAGTSLVALVEPGTTATAHALVPLTGNAADARCLARASAHDGGAGHHGERVSTGR
jgi:hypothetical protein